MVIDLAPDHRITAVNPRRHAGFWQPGRCAGNGLSRTNPRAIKIPGSRPAGVPFDRRTAQRYVNIENRKPGERIVILSFSDIGLIMARRLTLEGMHGAGFTVDAYANRYNTGTSNCLDDFDIPASVNHGNRYHPFLPHLEAVRWLRLMRTLR